MAITDILTKLFSSQPAQDNISPDGRPMNSSIQQYIEQMMPPVDKKAEQRKAISRGLLEFAKSIGSSNQPFLAALGQAAPAGAGGYLDARDNTDTQTKARNKDVMMQMFGLAKNEDASQYKSDALASREEIARMRDQQIQDRLDELGRHNKATEGISGDRIDLTSDLGLKRLEEIFRHNTATEGQGDTRLDQNGQRIDLTGQRVDETIRHNKANEAKQPPRANPSIAEAGKNRRAALKQLNDYIKGNAPTPEEAAAKKAEIFKDYGVDQPDTTQAQPVPAPMNTQDNPASIKSQAEYDALPPGSVFINPKDGKLKRKPQNGQPQ